jgi:hypothetical protein
MTMVEVSGDRVVDAREMPFLIQVIALANIAVGLLLLMRFAAYSSVGKGHLAILVAGCVELIVGLSLAFGAYWAYLATKVLQPLSLVASVWFMIDTRSGAALIPVAYFALTSYLLLAPARMTGSSGLAVRYWSAERRWGGRSGGRRPDGVGHAAEDQVAA